MKLASLISSPYIRSDLQVQSLASQPPHERCRVRFVSITHVREHRIRELACQRLEWKSCVVRFVDCPPEAD